MMLATMSAFPRGRPTPPPAALDPAVVARCRAQDPVAFRAFVVRHEAMVFALLSRMLVSPVEIEDLAQEAFVRAFRAFPGFDPAGPAKVSTWLLTIATRLALDARKRKRPGGEPLAEERLPSAAAAPDASLERRQLGRALAAAAEALPDDQRAAFVLSELHGLSIAEIAAALDVPENTAKTRLFRAREKMRAALRPEWRTP